MSHSYVPASVTFNGLNLRMTSYGGELIRGLVMEILSLFISSVPFLFQVPCTVTGVSTTPSRMIPQVKMTFRPWKKLVFLGDPEMIGGGGITIFDKNKMTSVHY